MINNQFKHDGYDFSEDLLFEEFDCGSSFLRKGVSIAEGVYEISYLKGINYIFFGYYNGENSFSLCTPNVRKYGNQEEILNEFNEKFNTQFNTVNDLEIYIRTNIDKYDLIILDE